MKRTILSWVSILVLIYLGPAANAQTSGNQIQVNKNKVTSSDGCFEVQYLGAKPKGTGLVTMSFEVKAKCDSNIEKVNFELPKKAGALGPVGFYLSKNKKYKFIAAVKEPFHAVEFQGIGGVQKNSKKKVKQDIFRYDISEAEFATMTSLKVAVTSASKKAVVEFALDKYQQANAVNGQGVTTLAECNVPLPEIIGIGDLCAGETVIFVIQANRIFSDIVWSIPTVGSDGKPSNWEIISGQGTNVLQVRLGDVSGTVSASLTIAGCGTQVISKAILMGDAIPLTIALINGTQTGVEEFTPGEIMTFNATANQSRDERLYNFTWQVPPGWTIISGQGTDQLVVQAGTEEGFVELNVSSNAEPPLRYCGLGYAFIEMIRRGGCEKPTLALSAPDSVCNLAFQGDDTIQVLNPKAGETYRFDLLRGDVDNNIPGFLVLEEDETQGTLIFRAFFGEENLGSQIITVTATNACDSTIQEVPVRVVDCAPGTPFPVTMTSFNGVSRGGAVELTWSTASEINNDRFEVERSLDARNFQKVGEVKGSGNSSVVVNYGYTDRLQTSGTVYYRLKQVDYDNAFEYTKVIAVNHRATGSGSLSIVPNPVSDGAFTVYFGQVTKGASTIKLLDMTGRQVLSKEVSAGLTEASLNVGQLSLRPGMYMVSVMVDGYSSSQRIVIQ